MPTLPMISHKLLKVGEAKQQVQKHYMQHHGRGTMNHRRSHLALRFAAQR